MLPVVNEHVAAKKVSVFNPAVQAKHPLSGLRLTNTTELHLMQGPITVFDGGTYAGNARIEDIAPGGERLLTYALDLDVECTSETTGTAEEIASVRLAKGILHAETQAGPHAQVQSQELGFQGQNRARRATARRRLEAARPKEPTEKTRDLYRFAVDVEPSKTAALEVVEDHLVSQQIQIANTDDATIRFFQSQRVIAPRPKRRSKESSS